MPYVPLVVAVCCAAFWYAAGEQELGSGVLWGGLSLVVSFAVIYLAGGAALAVVLANVGLLFVITAYRTLRDKDD
jgi:hypothetical protein